MNVTRNFEISFILLDSSFSYKSSLNLHLVIYWDGRWAFCLHFQFLFVYLPLTRILAENTFNAIILTSLENYILISPKQTRAKVLGIISLILYAPHACVLLVQHFSSNSRILMSASAYMLAISCFEYREIKSYRRQSI